MTPVPHWPDRLAPSPRSFAFTTDDAINFPTQLSRRLTGGVDTMLRPRHIAAMSPPSPDLPTRHTSDGLAAVARGDLAEAIVAFAAAAAANPASADAATNHALALLRGARAADALAEARRALSIDPAHAAAQATAGHAMLATGDVPGATAAFQALLAQHPDHADALHGLGLAQRAAGQFANAQGTLLRACTAQPAADAPRANLGLVQLECGEAPAAVASFAAATHAAPDTLAHASNAIMAMAYLPDLAPDAAFVSTRAWAAALEAGTPRHAGGQRALRRDGQLTIGYVSADLCRHPVGWLGGQAIALHDPDRCRAIVYDTGHVRDDISARIQAGVAGWRQVGALGDAALADLVATDGVDILVDLAGHTAGGRPRLFALKPAPVQAGWLGHVGSTGLARIDAALMDAATAPAATQSLFSERLLHLDDGRFAWTPPPEAQIPPDRLASHDGPIFGCFQALAKLNPAVAALWARVMDAVPGSRLRLMRRELADDAVAARLRAMFAAAGVDPARLDLRPAIDLAGLFAAYRDIDVALDPFPFCGGASTAEALWMGVPVVTRPGTAPASRQSLAMLDVIGCTQWAAADDDSYVAAVLAALADPDNRAQRRARLLDSPLGQPVRLVRALEAAFAALAVAAS